MTIYQVSIIIAGLALYALISMYIFVNSEQRMGSRKRKTMRLTRAQWKMVIISILATTFINGIVTYVTITIVNKHTTKIMTLTEAEDILYKHVTRKTYDRTDNQSDEEEPDE